MPSPIDRSRAALPANIRKTLEESNLPVEVATAIADLCEGLLPPEGESSSDAVDAARYRWLRDNGDTHDLVMGLFMEIPSAGWDEAIDREIARSPAASSEEKRNV